MVKRFSAVSGEAIFGRSSRQHIRSADIIVWDYDVLNVVDNRCGA